MLGLVIGAQETGPARRRKNPSGEEVSERSPGRALLTVAPCPRDLFDPLGTAKNRLKEWRSDLRLFIRRLEDLRRPRYQASTATADEQPT